MENADALDLSKENIQPLKRGRNTAQLGLALQAQSDPTLHQMFAKKQEWYEMQIRTYNGEDPLDLWCDYISWIEQSFPKHGPEGNLSLLLTKCFQAFKDEERYKNDARFVALWIKYIEMQTGSKRAELYQLLHTQGIGTTCADFYCSWAFEFQSVNDWKQADQIFKKGLSKMAQPIQTLETAHQQFLASYVFSHRSNGDTPDEEENHVQTDHRLPMAALKPIGKKSAAPNVRVGSNVRSQLPGVLPAMQGSSSRSGSSSSSRTFGVRGNNAGPVAVYQEHGEPEVEATHSQAVSSSLPITQSLNKENIVRAGPWTGQGLGSRKLQSTSYAQPYVPRQPGFEVHKDEDANVGNGQEMRPHSTTVTSALQPRKALEDGFQDAIAIFEEPDPYSIPKYRKNEVYAGGKEFQVEEIHALDYFRMKAEKEHKTKESLVHPDHKALYHKKLIPLEEVMPQDVQCSGSYGNGQMNVGDFHSPVRNEPSTSESLPVNFVSASDSNNYLAPPSAYGVPLSAEAEIVHHHMEHSEQPPLGHRPSNQSMHNHSMTLHTKLAMREVNNYWGSPSIVKSPTLVQNLVPEEVYHQPPPFQIMKDDTPPLQMSTYHGNETFPHEEMINTTSYTNGFQIYQEPQYQAPVEPSQSQKFAVFCDDADNNIGPVRTLSMEKGEQSSTYTSGSLMHKVAKEKENIHKFPIADMELMEDCGVAPVSDVTLHQPEYNDYGDYSHMQSPPEMYSQQPVPVSMASHDMVSEPHSHDSRQPAPAHVLTQLTPVSSSHSMMHSAAALPVSSSDAAHGMLLPPAPTHGLVQPGPTLNQVYQEPMEDDTMVASAPQFGVNMSETGITEAFFFPQMGAVSTPFRVSPKKSRASKSSIDFNSSLYRVEQSWPDEEENGAQGLNRAPDAPKTVPPLKLFRIKNDSDQLSAIVETSREQCPSAFSNNMSSLATNSRYGMYSTQRDSFGPTPYLNQINESPDPYQEPYSQEQAQTEVQTEVQPQVQNQPVIPARDPEILDPEQTAEMARRLEKREINPFDSRLLKFFLARMEFPLPHHSDGYHVVSGAVPAQRNKCLNLNGEVYTVAKVLGEGAYAKVLKGVHTITQKEVALKVQKPCCRWEYYICREIQHRLSNQDLVSAFMPADHIYVYNNGSVIVTDLLAYGTLLNLVNKVFASTKRQMTELQVLYLLDQLLSAVGALHKCRIIHGDLKPDNILIRSIPGSGPGPCIQFIDFGRSIDMSLMPDGATFDTVVMTDTFTCIEMRTGKPWTYQTDLFGLANTTHCLLFGDYMKVQESKSSGRWAIQSRLPRHVNGEFWTPFFDTLLNIESCDSLPDLESIRSDVQSRMSNSSQLSMTVSALGRLLLSR
ncbi:uncharacterized protein LOC117651430 [Thrips palmi]|uniref:Uncharacterized protein LOC117651430 n=1 Tax=Thrips palmi TaxID=161013 RepID=A0A6P9A3U1_THRPL|nr:uncharacterized protein LOC117651430 [Thrips palmi]